MDRQEVIRRIRMHMEVHTAHEPHAHYINIALEEAIKILEQENLMPCQRSFAESLDVDKSRSSSLGKAVYSCKCNITGVIYATFLPECGEYFKNEVTRACKSRCKYLREV